jgi:hypothetical protein
MAARRCKYTRCCLGHLILCQLVTMLMPAQATRHVRLASYSCCWEQENSLARLLHAWRTNRLGKSYARDVARIQETLLSWGGGSNCYLRGKPIAGETHSIAVAGMWQNPTRGKATAEGQANRQLKYRQTCKQANGGHDDRQ